MEKHFTHFEEHKNAEGILFHKDVYLPESLRDKAKEILVELDNYNVVLTKHASDILNKVMNDGPSRQFKLKDIWDATDFCVRRIKENKFLDIFEIGVDKEEYTQNKIKKICKIGFRYPLDMDRDLCVFLGFDNVKFSVITAYVNLKDDEHNEGLNKDRYIQRPKKVIIKRK